MKPITCNVHSWLSEIVNLVFPEVCPGCNRLLLKSESSLCLHCTSELPERVHLNNTEINQRFYGRVQLEEAHEYLLFKRKGLTQKLLHAIKYQGNEKLAIELGMKFGERCKEYNYYSSVDTIVPIPLHKSKERLRGYNQSELLARGLSEAMEVPFNTTSVIRKFKTSTQTRKNRQERWKNVEHIFSLNDHKLKSKHVLLVDDVITTGATLESCAQLILDSGVEKVSVACIALA